MPDGWFLFGEGGGRLFDLSRAPMGVVLLDGRVDQLCPSHS